MVPIAAGDGVHASIGALGWLSAPDPPARYMDPREPMTPLNSWVSTPMTSENSRRTSSGWPAWKMHVV